MPGYKLNRALSLGFPPKFLDGGSGLRLDEECDLKLLLVCPWVSPPWLN